MSMPVAVVTGSRGFIGQHVLLELVARGTRVITIGRESSRPGAGPNHVTLRDVSDGQKIRRVIQEQKPVAIYHMAGTAETDNIEELYRANVIYACTVLSAARSVTAPPTVVLAGSATEYGLVPAKYMPVRETFPSRPTSHYGISKLTQTLHGLAAAGEGTPVVIARLFNPVGARMPRSLALGSFAAQIACMPADGGSLITGDLDSVRDFAPVREVARVLVALAQTPAAYGSIVNVCTGRGTSLLEFVELMVARAGVPVRIERDPARTGTNAVKNFVGDPSRLRSFGLTIARQDHTALIDEIMGSYGRSKCALDPESEKLNR
jgi:nucleoside-diphosphate-sugar epimerase